MPMLTYYGEALASYGFGRGHPFGPDRLEAFWREMTRQGLDRKTGLGTPVACTEQELALFHTGEYIARVQHQSKTGEGYLDYGDTPAFPGVYEAGAVVVGSVLNGLKKIIAGACQRVFVPIAGLHHARRDSASGFCVFNDIGVLIEALRKHGIARVAYVDIDAHHGDGVFYSFEDDPDLIFADIHEDGRYLYPGTGAATETGTGKALGTKLNLPMEPGADDAAFHRVWPRVEEFVRAGKPEFIILQAGADSIAGDPITHMQFTPAVHAHATTRLCALADEFCQGRIIATGGGGYNRANLARAWTGVVEAMLAA
ncbi:MAG: acetoin utilization protein AcuC [Gammaproteobacteria bacterium]|nr:acetoin utilization protein AcuC [Gammaproteobacteria bacterium]MDH3407644.1 acetoin utilization protein AcuC [Gammaproteobacteria bacterium]